MLPRVKTWPKKLEGYQKFTTKKQLEQIKHLSQELKGLKVAMVNSTPRGGGVAEVMKSLVPMMKGVGIKVEWYTIPGREDFFKITKEMHNALQGKQYEFGFKARKRYLKHMERTACLMQDMRPDLWIIHDPQPAGTIQYLSNFHPSVCRLHIDLTTPNREVWDFVSGYLAMYDRVVVSSKDFVRPEVKKKTIVFPPAIDPLSPKNQPLDVKNCREIIKSFGINPNRPLVTQVSRFDPWKAPMEVVKSYQLAKKKIPDLQLAMVGLFLAQDDPEAIKVYKEVRKATGGDPDVFLFADPKYLGGLKISTFVNSIQGASDIILQNSKKEGFGLTVAEAMWKEKPVIGGGAAGIKYQIKQGKNGFVASTPKEMSERIEELIKDPQLASKISRNARRSVKRNFLMPRLLKDYLFLFKHLILNCRR